jgi:xanthine dehydrogenase/oxidase
LAEDLPLRPDAPGGSVPYRRTLSTSFFFKFYLAVQSLLVKKGVRNDYFVFDESID